MGARLWSSHPRAWGALSRTRGLNATLVPQQTVVDFAKDPLVSTFKTQIHPSTHD
jgi:hypothetical protein